MIGSLLNRLIEKKMHNGLEENVAVLEVVSPFAANLLGLARRMKRTRSGSLAAGKGLA